MKNAILEEKLEIELNRLKVRLQESKNGGEMNSLKGSILTVEKILKWVK